MRADPVCRPSDATTHFLVGDCVFELEVWEIGHLHFFLVVLLVWNSDYFYFLCHPKCHPKCHPPPSNVIPNIRKLELHFLQTVGWLVPSTTLYHFVAILLAVSNSSSKLAEKTWQCARSSLLLPSTCSYASTVAAECFQQSVATEQSVAECSNLPELWLKWAKGKDNHHANSKKRKLNEL